jgi:hypothetical protein
MRREVVWNVRLSVFCRILSFSADCPDLSSFNRILFISRTTNLIMIVRPFESENRTNHAVLNIRHSEVPDRGIP